MLNWIKKLFAVKTLRERGQDFAYEFLQKGGTYEGLAVLADDPFDFNDFDRGILDVVRNRGCLRGSDETKK